MHYMDNTVVFCSISDPCNRQREGKVMGSQIFHSIHRVHIFFTEPALYSPDLMTQSHRCNMKCNKAIMATDMKKRELELQSEAGIYRSLHRLRTELNSNLLAFYFLAENKTVPMKIGCFTNTSYISFQYK